MIPASASAVLSFSPSVTFRSTLETLPSAAVTVNSTVACALLAAEEAASEAATEEATEEAALEAVEEAEAPQPASRHTVSTALRARTANLCR